MVSKIMWREMGQWLVTIWGNLILARLLYDKGFKPQVRGSAGTYICLIVIGVAHNTPLPLIAALYCALMRRMFEHRFRVCVECEGGGGGCGDGGEKHAMGTVSAHAMGRRWGASNYYGAGSKTNNQESFPVKEPVFERYRRTMGYLTNVSERNFGWIFFGHFIRWNNQCQYPKPMVVLLVSEGRSECLVRTTEGWWTVRSGEEPRFHVELECGGIQGTHEAFVH